MTNTSGGYPGPGGRGAGRTIGIIVGVILLLLLLGWIFGLFGAGDEAEVEGALPTEEGVAAEGAVTEEAVEDAAEEAEEAAD